MVTSLFYKELLKRHNELKKAFLPKQLSPTGNYSDLTYERVAAYILLIHAALEYYFEQVALSIAKDSMTKWNTEKKATKTVVALISYSPIKHSAIPETTNDQRAVQDLDFRVKEAYTNYNNYIRSQNHGIKETNILSIFLPIGLTIAEIDNNMLAELNSFGIDRGTIAHTTKARQQIPPEDAETKIILIMSLVKNFDEMLCKNYCLQ